jgi:trehalose synthase
MDVLADSAANARLISVEDYEPLVGAQTVERILKKAAKLRDLHVINISSTYYGGGVAELLSSLTLLMNTAGIPTGWRIIQGRPDFFSITKKMHNALQGADINLSELKRGIYEAVVFENAVRMHLDHDLVVVHDPQPLPLIMHYRKKAPWVWRCHIDLSRPHQELWSYLGQFIERYDAVVLSLPEYAQKISQPQRFIMPAINPFSTTNKELSDAEINDRLEHYGIPTDLPLVVQVSRFDKWKDPQGVIDAFQIARREVDATLVLVGNVATDDPEGQDVFQSVCGRAEERIRGKAGGIRHQIEDGVNGFLVESVEQAAQRIVQVIRDPDLRRRLGEKARASVAARFLMTRQMEDWLDLIGAFEPHFRLRGDRGA